MYRPCDMLGHTHYAVPGSKCLFELAADAERAGAASILGMHFEHGTANAPKDARRAKGLYDLTSRSTM